MMQRRKLLGTLGLGLALPQVLRAQSAPNSAIEDGGELHGGGLFFFWQHQGAGLVCGLQGKVQGWLAIGFSVQGSKEPAHVIAAAPAAGIGPVERIGLTGPAPAQATFSAASATYGGGYAKIAFTLPHQLPGRAALKLEPFSFAWVTLAWSATPDLSAPPDWQETYNIRL